MVPNKFIFSLLLVFMVYAPAFADASTHDELDYLGAFGNGGTESEPPDIKVLQHGSRSLMKVALTFDDGPFAYTGEILDVLAEHGVKATFFLVGTQVEQFPHVAKRIVDEGHEIGNHSYSHKHLTRVDPAVWKYEIDQCSVVIYKAIGVLPRLFRPPYDLFNEEILDYVNSAGMILVQWDVDPTDWAKPSAKKIRQRIMREVRPGAIIICHDFSKGTRLGLGSLIDALQENEYELVTVGEMISDLMPESQKVETSKEGVF
jgi:peptidoglycan/xylan/chitin deacetylase (PgdA/CDA1 family)